MDTEPLRRASKALLCLELVNQSVRPALAYGFGAATIVFTGLGYLTPEAFLGIAAMVLGFFFQARAAEKAEARLQEQQEQLLALAKALPPPSGLPPEP